MKNKLFENETTVIFEMAPSTNSQSAQRLRYCRRRVDQNSCDVSCKCTEKSLRFAALRRYVSKKQYLAFASHQIIIQNFKAVGQSDTYNHHENVHVCPNKCANHIQTFTQKCFPRRVFGKSEQLIQMSLEKLYDRILVLSWT